MSYLTRAIQKLQPEAEFTFINDDYSTIEWIKLDGNAPSKKQIDDAIKAIKTFESSEAETKAAAKAALLERLGITEDEAKLLLS